ncbi:unnamed protein product [Rhizoctonia solani]|uniref:Transmembrane protein n=1 Tax=Rhizoctonia solani TaxID=456999 RepID=A0A8H3GI35_9AGAM|nr:unnamed protein product [Rhizoctonia solani]CAE6472445.1 unnamed protein product [Rhizoctonia solani]
MSSFLRFAGAAALVLSFGLFVRALPVVSVSIPTITGTDAVSVVCAKLSVSIEAHIKALLACGTIADVEAAIKAMIVAIKICSDDLVKIGTGVVVDVDAQASIVACIAALITLIVRVCLQLSVKFGIAAVAALYAELDVCIRLLLGNLDVCIAGIVALIVKACVGVTASLLASINMKVCADIIAKLAL